MDRTMFPGVSRTNPTSLAKQVAEGYKRLMKSGRLKAGTVLPSRAVIAAELGLSEYSVRSGLDSLVAEGLLVSRAGIGYTVVGRRPKSLFANVLYVTVAHYDAYSVRVVERLIQQELAKAGCGVTCAYFDDESPQSLRLLRLALQSRPDFVVLNARLRRGSPVFRTIRATGIPTLSEDRTSVAKRYASAFEDLAAACQTGGILSVAQFNFSSPPSLDAAPMLERRGIYVEQINCAAAEARTLEDVQRAALAAMRGRLRRGTLPDLLLFNDDYLTRGALPALMEGGVRIPEDVRLVTLVNRGAGPVFSKSLARFENDAFEIGHREAARIISWIRTGTCPASTYAVKFVPGETFPESLKT